MRVHAFSIKPYFDELDAKEQSFVHFLSRAAWHGARIILHQTSPEANSIFDLIIQLYRACNGDWTALAERQGVSKDEVGLFVEYAACFLSNVGNYCGASGYKFVPRIPKTAVVKLAACSEATKELWDQVGEAMYARPPYCLGVTGGAGTQSAYYLGAETPTAEESESIATALAENGLWPENTRIEKTKAQGETVIRVLQASEDFDPDPRTLATTAESVKITVERGDLNDQLWMVCRSLNQASRFSTQPVHQRMLYFCIKSLESGDLNLYRQSLQLWLQNQSPRVEQVFGFAKPHRDPAGTKAEFQGLVGIVNAKALSKAERLKADSSRIVGALPWVANRSETEPFGPFERPDIALPTCLYLYEVSYCSSVIMAGLDLPLYHDIRDALGHKSLILSNGMQAQVLAYHDIAPLLLAAKDQVEFLQLSGQLLDLYVLLQSYFGRSVGKMLREVSPGQYNFDRSSPPKDLITGHVLENFYQVGQTLGSVYQDLAPMLDECRARLVAALLLHDAGIYLALRDDDQPSANQQQLQYNLYLLLAVDGILGLRSYNDETKAWGSALGRARFAMLRYILRHGSGVLRIEHAAETLKVVVDASKIGQGGQQAVSSMLVQLHMYWCSPDVAACRHFYDELTRMDDEAAAWWQQARKLEVAMPLYVQGNTVLESGQQKVRVQEYEATNEGIIQSWAERDV